MKNYNALKYFQENQEYFITVMPFSVVNNISYALIYGENDYGYQRALNQSHYKKICRSAMKTDELISPTSIVLGVNKSEFINNIELERENIFNLKINENDKIFRIIDGQHRLKGLEIAACNKEELYNYNLSVIIMVIDDKKRRTEVKVFNDINSKAKPLKMDLTILALYKYDILEKVKDIDIKEHVAVKIAYVLNEGYSTNSIWKNAIKLDVNNYNSIGIIGFKTFYESIHPICDMLINNEKEIINKNSFDEIFSYVDNKAKEIANGLLGPCWEVIYYKWNECFRKPVEITNYEEIETFFDTDYYLQKTMGTKAINWLIYDYLKENNGNVENAIIQFKERIQKSMLSNNDWKVGGRFLGLSSESGFKKIKELI